MEPVHNVVLRFQPGKKQQASKGWRHSHAVGWRAGRSFLKGAANVGAAYGAQWKTTSDTGSGIPPLLPITNGRVCGVGPEIDMPVFAKGRNVGLVSFRYL